MIYVDFCNYSFSEGSKAHVFQEVYKTKIKHEETDFLYYSNEFLCRQFLIIMCLIKLLLVIIDLTGTHISISILIRGIEWFFVRHYLLFLNVILWHAQVIILLSPYSLCQGRYL